MVVGVVVVVVVVVVVGVHYRKEIDKYDMELRLKSK